MEMLRRGNWRGGPERYRERPGRLPGHAFCARGTALLRHEKMKVQNRLWIVLAGAAILVAGNGVILYYVSSHLALSAAVIAAVIGMASQ
jgi:hypothetical protein